MNPETIARAYVSCVELEDRLRAESPEAADQLGDLRGELHALLMECFRESGIPFANRADAARLAFELAHKPASLPLA